MEMDSDDSAPSSTDTVHEVPEKKNGCRSSCSRKKSGKVSRKIHKAEREKQKRDHMNVLFLELEKALEEPPHHNHGKASILNDSIKLLRDLINQIDCLKKENAALLSESHYLTIERNELQEEKSGLEVHNEKLQTEIEEKAAHSNSRWNLGISQALDNTNAPQLHEDQQPVISPVFVLPFNQDPQTYPIDTIDVVSKLPINISKPQARYPSASDSWPSQILADQTKLQKDSQHELQLSTNKLGL